LIAINGSLAAHECCAEAVAVMRAQKLLSLVGRIRREIYEDSALNNVGGRTQPLGRDSIGQLYWQFPHEPDMLLIQPLPENGWEEGRCVPRPAGAEPAIWENAIFFPNFKEQKQKDSHRKWMCYTDLRDIAGQFLKLDANNAYEMNLQRSMLRRFHRLRETFFNFLNLQLGIPNVEKETEFTKDDKCSGNSSALTAKPNSLYNVGSRVLISTLPRRIGMKFSYEGVITHSPIYSNIANKWLVRVAPKGWPARFSNFLPCDSIEINGKLPERDEEKSYVKMRTRFLKNRPRYVPGLLASEALEMPRRAREKGQNPPCFEKYKLTLNSLEMTRSTLLTIEAGLPIGAWKGVEGLKIEDWRKRLLRANSALELMEACILLESSIGLAWIRGGGLCDALLPPPFAALQASTPAAVCLRAWVLDRSLVYDRAEDPGKAERRTNRKSSSAHPRVAATEAEFVMGVGIRRVAGAKRSHSRKKFGIGRS